MTTTTAIDTRPILEFDRNNAGRIFIGVTELDGRGYGVRAFVLSEPSEHTAEIVMRRRFDDMVRLMGDNVQVKISTVVLTCDMETNCHAPITHIDDKGYAYCTTHGEQRRSHRPCRKLRPHELRKLQRGEALARY